jgi:hypothetical protein
MAAVDELSDSAITDELSIGSKLLKMRRGGYFKQSFRI